MVVFFSKPQSIRLKCPELSIFPEVGMKDQLSEDSQQTLHTVGKRPDPAATEGT